MTSSAKRCIIPPKPALADGHLPDMPNDVGRIKEIADLINRGWIDQILISHDNCLKTNFTRWGGPGFAHIIERAIPYMRVYGYTESRSTSSPITTLSA